MVSLADKEHKKITVGSVLSWIFGVIFVLGGLGALISLQIKSALVLFIMAIVLLPPVYKFVSDKFNFELSKGIKALIIIVGLLAFFIFTDTEESPTTQQGATTTPIPTPTTIQEKPKETAKQPKTTISTNLPPIVIKPEYDLELTLDDIINTFDELSEVQQEEKFKQLKGKRIKTSIRADKVNEATFSSQLVVLQMSDLYSCTAKAFFPKEYRNDLLQVGLGDTITFSGEFVDYKFGFASCIEFGKSRLLSVEKGEEGYKGEYQEAKEELGELKERLGEYRKTRSKVDECAEVCAGEDSNIPAVKSAFWTSCYEIYTYAGEEELDQMIADCKE